MRKLLIAPVLAFGLSGCITAQPTVVDISTKIAQVQQLAVQACGFLPTADFVADLFLTDNASLQSALAWATAICQATVLTPAQRAAARAGRPPRVNGVVVQGRFVRAA